MEAEKYTAKTEEFLENIGVSAETASDDACKIEHVVGVESGRGLSIIRDCSFGQCHIELAAYVFEELACFHVSYDIPRGVVLLCSVVCIGG